MTNFLTNLFSKSSANNQNNLNQNNTSNMTTNTNYSPAFEALQQQHTIPTAAQFLADVNPEPITNVVKKETLLDVFKNVNYKDQGIKDGYTMHSEKFCTLKLREMQAAFRTALDEKIHLIAEEQQHLQYIVSQLGTLANEQKNAFENKILRLDEVTIELNNQKMYSASNEGRIAEYIHAYMLGYEIGIMQYSQTNNFLADIDF